MRFRQPSDMLLCNSPCSNDCWLKTYSYYSKKSMFQISIFNIRNVSNCRNSSLTWGENIFPLMKFIKLVYNLLGRKIVAEIKLHLGTICFKTQPFQTKGNKSLTERVHSAALSHSHHLWSICKKYHWTRNTALENWPHNLLFEHFHTHTILG